MTEQMSFVYAKTTKHVLSVISGVASPSTPLAAFDLASPSLLFRDSSTGLGAPDVRFYITPDQLDIFTGDKVAAAFLEPRSYSVDKDKKKLEALPALGSDLGLTMSSTGVDVDLTSDANATLDILIFYSGADPSKSETASGTITSGSRHGHVPTSPLPSGTQILVLVSGFTPRIEPVP